MRRLRNLPSWVVLRRLEAPLLTGLVLFIASYLGDVILESRHVSLTSTILNNLVVGILGGLTLLVYLSASHEYHTYKRAKEQMAMIGEVNRQVREALLDITESAMVEDRTERLMRLDEATERIDHVLTRLVPTAAASGTQPQAGETRPALVR
ncbi:MAG TPA: hypothetical protein VN933_14785 [Candidatus Eremiobacteraceae bacterium]|jgi:hypothetical protein|nr:hypothetical protein [Candidatus Eremiobacteraceae bacterium]